MLPQSALLEKWDFTSIKKFMHNLLNRLAIKDPHGKRIVRSYTQTELSLMIGVSREMISRTMKQLERDGKITIGREERSGNTFYILPSIDEQP